MDTVFLLVSEVLKIPKAKIEAHFLKKPAFVTNKVQHKIPLENVQGQQKTFQNTRQYANSYMHKFSHFSYIPQSYPSK